MVRSIMKDVKPTIARYIGIMENNTITDLKANIRKYEMVEFMITGETVHSSSDIKHSIITEQLNQITNQLKFKQLTHRNMELKTQLEKFKSAQYQQSFQPKNKFLLNHKTINTFSQNPQVTPQIPVTPAINSWGNVHDNNRPQCEICSRFNHIKENCYF